MEFLGKVFEIVKNVGELLEIVKNIKEWYGYHSGLEENMKTLKRKIEYLSAQENDINKQISSAEHRPWKKRKTEVEVWLRDEQQTKNDVQSLEQEVVGEKNLFSRVRLGKRIIEKIQEVERLQEKGRAFDGLLVDDLPNGELLMPPTKDFVESTEARNVERVWECLMNEDVRQIGVYGMGGVGKTTIMKHIHNRILKETDKFDKVYWVTISKAFNVPKLQSDIAKALNLRFLNDDDETIRAAELHETLSRKKKYVLILDDLWEAFPMESVGIPEPTQINGCKILLTTRSLDVCRGMDCTAVKVELLTEQEALTLFLRKTVRNDVVLAPDVKQIAAKIAKKCARLPLAIVTVAGSLRGVEGTHEWRDALNEFTNLMNEANGGENEVFEQLKFSYSRLGDKVVQDCFLCCSLYPEDCEIAEYQLIELWIAEGLIPEMNSVEAMVDKCHSILGKLTSTCLLETASEFGSRHVRIHDVIRDMAFKITRGRYRCMEKDGGLWSEDHEKISFMFKSKMTSFIFNHRTELPIRPPVCPRLTTLLLENNGISLIPDSFFNNMPCLRVLDLSHNMIQSLPESISNLENLHALILSRCEQLEYVPSMEKLKALKVFILTWSLIKEAPKGIEQLVNLIKLDLSYNRRLETFPSTKLCGLSKLLWLIIDGTRVQVSREDLMCLSQLKVVCVQFHNVQELTMYVTSQQFHGLEQYRLGVGETIEKNMYSTKSVAINVESKHFQSGVEQLVLPEDTEEFVLRGSHDLISLSSMPSLKNARDLYECEISSCSRLESIYSSSSFTEDGHISLSSVFELILFDLPRCRVLFDGISPAHNISFNLTELSISNCHSMKYILPAQLLQNLPNLERLEVERCKIVEEIIVGEEEMNGSHHRDDSNTITFPRLKELRLIFLPRLKSIYTGTMVCETEFNISVNACPMLRRLPLSLHMDNNQATAPPSLKHIWGDEEWWESLEWDDPRTKTVLQPFFETDLLSQDELNSSTSDDTMSISDYESTSGTAKEEGVLPMEEYGEVVTQGQKPSPEDKQSLTRVTDEVSHLSDEELLEEISLEELEETPSNPQELENLNCGPMEVPPTLSHHFSILHVLDLSYAEIKSLPHSISRLVALQKLYLRSCELLMELPPEIGELTNLEVLDLEGTEILCLPKEIAKLVNLKCLKVSFYAYANRTLIPRRVLSYLSCLNELIIDVTPYGEWWDVEVEAIIDELRNLKELRTLKLYLPTAKILEDLLLIFPGLANFRFTVGRYVEHFVSRLPRDAEKEFNNWEKLEKGLKYMNGSHIPNEITEVFKHTNAFFLQRHWTAKSLSEFGHENMNDVKFCLVMECNEVQTIIDLEQYYQGKDGRSESEDFLDFDETIILGSLQKMIIRCMKNMGSIWKGPVGKGSLSNLKSLALHTCPNLTALFTIDMLSNLINLEELIVEDCPKIDSLVSLKSSGSKLGVFLLSLKKILLLGLPELVSISSGLWIAPKLERMVIFYCPKLEKLSTTEVSSKELKVIKGEKEWWDALKWYESDLSKEHEDYLARLFIPLRRDGNLMAQFTED